MNPSRDTLLASLRERPRDGAVRDQETRALVRRAGTLEKAREWLRVFEQFLPPGAEGSLREVLQFALLGLCLGFVERDSKIRHRIRHEWRTPAPLPRCSVHP